MRSDLLLGCLLVFLNIVTVKPDVVIVNVKDNALVAVLTGVINLENLADLKQRITSLEKNLTNGTIGNPLEDAVNPLPPTEPRREENSNNSTHDLHPSAWKAFVTESLINTLEGSNNAGITNVSALIADLSIVAPKVYSEVIERVLHKSNNSVDNEQFLSLIVRNKDTAQVISNLNALLRKLKATGDLNDSVLLNLASELSKLRNRTEFNSLDPTNKYTFNNTVDNLPECARNLFFMFVRTEKFFYKKRDLEFVIQKFKVSRNKDAFLFKITIDTHNEYLYVSEDHSNVDNTWHIVRIGQPLTTVDAKLWNIELAGDNCYLKNVHYKEYMFFDTYYKYTGPRRDTDIMWKIRNCQ